MVPSVINLIYAGFSFFRSFAPVRRYLLNKLTPGRTLPFDARIGPAFVLTVQSAVALAFAVGAQGGLVYLFFVKLKRVVGEDILAVVSRAAL